VNIFSNISSDSLFSFGIFFLLENNLFFENVNISENHIISVELAKVLWIWKQLTLALLPTLNNWRSGVTAIEKHNPITL
jgi:hypothetical protein